MNRIHKDHNLQIIVAGMVIAMLINSLTPLLAAEGDVNDQDKKQDSEPSATELAKKAQNPVENMISVPFQWNSYFETGPKGKTQNVLLIQPVIPFSLNEEFNFIARPIIPLIEQPPYTDDQNRNHGLGNIQFQGFFSPKEPTDSGWILGMGPYFEFPTNSGPDGRFGSDNWSAGPAFVALKIDGPWVYGALIAHLWSYYGNDPEVNQTTIQPILNYNLPDGWYLSATPIITSNWSADSSDQWTIPIGGGIGKILKIGNQNVNTALRAYYNVESPDSGSDWQLQFSMVFLFPK